MAPKPRKSLDSTRLQNSLRAYILNLISKRFQALACRAVWKVNSEDVELARYQIASKRLRLDDVLSSIQGVQFYFSCVTSVMSNAKSSQIVDQQASPFTESYPAIAFFIVYNQCDTCNESTLFSALHNEDMEPEITPIRVRTQLHSNLVDSNKEMELAARQLFNVVKDHNNASIQEMLDVSNVYCFRNAQESSSESDDEEDLDDLLNSTSTRFPLVPCCLFVVNVHDFGDQLNTALAKLQSDGLVAEMGVGPGIDIDKPCFLSNNDISTAIHQIEKAMTIFQHAIYRSHVYAKPDEAAMTFVQMTDVSSYLHRLLGNETLRDNLLRHFASIEKFLTHPACEIIQQIQFDLDLIEVSNGYCFSIKSRSFIACPIPSSMLGKLSPRAFVPYDHTTPPEPNYFQEGILNSFPDDNVRIRFLNKFYQCFSAFKMPHKVKKLVVAGPKDSGKTSWSNIFHRIVPAPAIASLTQEKQFSAAMITNETQLVIVDEWSTSTMQSDLAKSILQGGWIVTAVKHGLPRTVLNNSPFYITTNHVPNFGDENENVRRRIDIFTTQSLPRTRPGVDRWMYDHAMDCVAWIAEEINVNRHFIAQDELWYEAINSQPLTIGANENESLFDVVQLKRLSETDLRNENVEEEPRPVIHETFATESRMRRVKRKRRTARQKPFVNTTSSDTDVEIPSEVASDVPSSLQQRSPNVVNEDDDPGEKAEFTLTPPNDNEREDNGNIAMEEQPESVLNQCSLPLENEVSSQLAESNDEQQCSPTPAGIPEPTPQPHHASFIDQDNEQKRITTSGEPSSTSNIDVNTPPRGWTLNDQNYLGRVSSLIKYGLRNSVTKAQVHCFLERLRKALMKRSQDERDFWTTADPEIDAWMILTGRKREVFDITSFVAQHPDILTHLQSLRSAANLLVLSTRCPVSTEIERQMRQTVGRTSNVEEREEVPSQSYWSVVKRWVHW